MVRLYRPHKDQCKEVALASRVRTRVLNIQLHQIPIVVESTSLSEHCDSQLVQR